MEELLCYLASYPHKNGKALREYVEKFIEEHPEYEMHRGATRICVFHPSWDFVIKFDENFETTQYCALELYHYEMAKQYNVQKVLLPTSKHATYENGLKVYQQTKYSIGWREVKGKVRLPLQNAMRQMGRTKNFSNICRGMRHETHEMWIARTTQLYGKKFMRSLQAWIDEYNINDLHTGNIGLLNGNPVLLDYAGYRGQGYTPSKEITDNY